MNEKTYNELKELKNYIESDVFQKHVCAILEEDMQETNDIRRCLTWETTIRNQGKIEGLAIVNRILQNIKEDIQDWENEH